MYRFGQAQQHLLTDRVAQSPSGRLRAVAAHLAVGPSVPQSMEGRCRLCGGAEALSAVARRCEPCANLMKQASNTGSSRRVAIDCSARRLAIQEAVGRRRQLYPGLRSGYVCAYSEILLEVDKNLHKGGDYASFDHDVPNCGDRAVLCSRIVNDLKGWMTGKEFREFVRGTLNPTAPRRIHGVDEQTSRRFLEALRIVMAKNAGPEELAQLRRRLKDLSRGFRY